MKNNDKYILKYHLAGWSNIDVGKKLGLTETEVSDRLLALAQTETAMSENGYMEFTKTFIDLCQRYQSVGESLKVVAAALELADVDDLRKCIMDNPKDPATAVFENFIILPKFKSTEDE